MGCQLRHCLSSCRAAATVDSYQIARHS